MKPPHIATNRIFYLLISIVYFLACTKKDNSVTPKPVASFEYNIKGQGSLPDTVAFINNSVNATSYAWTFDDGNSSLLQNPVNIYFSARTYQVKLVVTGTGGKDSIIKPITITLEKPKANFDFVIQNSGTIPTRVLFTNKSVRADSVVWNFEEGGNSRIINPQIDFTASKSYRVTLMAYNSSGIDSISKQVIIPPVNYSIRVFLITPIDKPFSQSYYDILKSTALNIQAWYKQQTGGKTFILNNPIVDTLRGLHTYAWYNSDNGLAISGTDPRFYGYYNTLYEISQLITTNKTLYTYIFYTAAPGGGAGATGQAALGDQDLDGLLQEKNSVIKRWIGGSAHEWGHAFGLPHPDNQLGTALMWTGYTIYPNCILQQNDRDILSNSKFFK